MERLRWLDAGIKAVMFIGHNPGIAQFAAELSAPEDGPQEKLHRRMRDKFSTGALAVIGMRAKSWRDVRSGRGALTDFTRPKDL
jgi:phosphohistidine phosphatase SixA